MSQNKAPDKSGDLDTLLASIDKQLLLKLLDSLIEEQGIPNGNVSGTAALATASSASSGD